MLRLSLNFYLKVHNLSTFDNIMFWMVLQILHLWLLLYNQNSLGDKVPADAQGFKKELARITKYVTDLSAKTRVECDKYANDVKFWAEYRTGIKEFTPWLVAAESSFNDGLAKPSSLQEAQELSSKVHGFEKTCADHLKVLEAAKKLLNLNLTIEMQKSISLLKSDWLECNH